MKNVDTSTYVFFFNQENVFLAAVLSLVIACIAALPIAIYFPSVEEVTIFAKTMYVLNGVLLLVIVAHSIDNYKEWINLFGYNLFFHDAIVTSYIFVYIISVVSMLLSGQGYTIDPFLAVMVIFYTVYPFMLRHYPGIKQAVRTSLVWNPNMESIREHTSFLRNDVCSDIDDVILCFEISYQNTVLSIYSAKFYPVGVEIPEGESSELLTHTYLEGYTRDSIQSLVGLHQFRQCNNISEPNKMAKQLFDLLRKHKQ